MHHPSLVRPSGHLNTQAFFDDFCPKAIRLRTPSRSDRIAFFIVGQGGGRWCVDLGTGEVRTELPEGHVALVCRMSVEHFDALLNGGLDARSAVENGDVELAGDLSLLSVLAELFAPA